MSQIGTPAVPPIVATIDGHVECGGLGIPQVTVFLDTNNNGADESDFWTETKSDGSFELTYPGGATVVRIEVPAGFQQVAPASALGIHVSVAAGAKDTVGFVIEASKTQAEPITPPVVTSPAPTPEPTPPNLVAQPEAPIATNPLNLPTPKRFIRGGNIGGAPKSDPLGIAALDKFGFDRVRLWQYGQFAQKFPAQLLADIATYRSKGKSVCLTFNFQNNMPRLGMPTASVLTAYLDQLPPASQIGQLICEFGNEIDDAKIYYAGGAPAYAAGFSLFADIMHSKGHLVCVGNMTSYDDAMNLGNPASGSLYMQLAKIGGVFNKADFAGGHYYTSDHASSLRAHIATDKWLKLQNPAILSHSSEINQHQAGAAWPRELGLLISGLESAGIGGDLFPLYPTGTAASAGSLLDANGNVTACGTAFLAAE